MVKHDVPSGVRRRGSWRGPAVPETVGQARAAVGRFIAAHDVDDVTSANVRLCVSEAVTNAVVHAPAGGRVDTVVSVSAERGEDALVITVTDNGDGFRHTTVSQGLGLGLPLIAALSTSMTISKCVDGGTEVSITFAL